MPQNVGQRFLLCVRIRVRKIIQNLLKLEKIGKSVENHMLQFQLLIIN
jgi:hypothetical protein